MIRIVLIVVFAIAVLIGGFHFPVWAAWLLVLGFVGAWWWFSATGNGKHYVTPSAFYKCPFCFKRSKLGASACHHCGRSLVE